MIRYLLIFLIVFLILRLFVLYGSMGRSENRVSKNEGKSSKPTGGVPKGIGEYIDYEEVKKSKE
jgi:Na+/H+ antiporter NhaC